LRIQLDSLIESVDSGRVLTVLVQHLAQLNICGAIVRPHPHRLFEQTDGIAIFFVFVIERSKLELGPALGIAESNGLL
jgi:hypothetical protein